MKNLLKYFQKRPKNQSPEPRGGKPDEGNKLRFVIQKHAASHLHYDFRLELQGVLKSWAVPKGPSTNPQVKRLAIQVEDHPYDYRNFEGVIPSGYGAGTVMIWDEGFYEPLHAEGKDKKTMTRELVEGLKKGKIHFILDGHKLKGEYALVKTSGTVENGWLLFKIKDQHASAEDITLKNKSVISKKTLDQIKGKEKKTDHDASNKVPVKDKKEQKKITNQTVEKAETKKKKKEKNNGKNHDLLTSEFILEQAPKGRYFTSVKPMLATLVDSPFEEKGWQYEIKWDGYRAIAFMNKGKVDLKSRNNKPMGDKFYPILKALKEWNVNAIVDGEIVVINNKGISNFGSLQNWRSEADGELHYYIFDILWLDGKNLQVLPLNQRKIILETLIPENSLIRYSQSFEKSGIEFFEAAKKIGLEGIVAKKSDSLYSQGLRTKDWLKIKANKRQEMVIGGYTKNEETSKEFSSLLVGVFKGKQLYYTGKVGTGFTDRQQKEMLEKFKKLVVKKSPFVDIPDINKPSRFRPHPPHARAIWLKPELVCEVSYAEMTMDGVMRHPSFGGMRIDKKAKEVVKENAQKTNQTLKENHLFKEHKMIATTKKQERKTLLNPSEETQVRKIDNHELKFTHLNKLYWPKEKITKGDLLNYYYQVAPYMLPYLKDRPQSMLRHPDGINGESFFFKDITGKGPEWLETFRYHSPADDRDRNYLVVEDEASLLYMVSLGCIEINPWHSRVQTEDFPDWCIIDLDPGNATFNQVIEAAQVTKEVLDSFGIASYPKTSGSKGIHIYIPLGAKYTYDESKEFARVIARLVHEKIPSFTTIERTVRDRKGKMYLDFLQNRPQATVAAPYSVRPKPGATVSMPLHWNEVKKGLKMSDFTIFNAMDRIKSEGDIFKPVLGKGINLQKAIKKFENQ